MLEDLGFYCVDNLPISLVDKFAQLAAAGSDISQAALGIDIRSGEELSQLDAVLMGMEGHWGWITRFCSWMPMTASLIKRYKETRRSHPWPGQAGWTRELKRRGSSWLFSKRTRTSSLTPASSYQGAEAGAGEDIPQTPGVLQHVCHGPFLWL